MILILSVLSAGEERCSACQSAGFLHFQRDGSLRGFFFLDSHWVYMRFSFKYHLSGEKRFLPLFDQFIDKRKSDRYMNLSGKETLFCSESSMLGAIEGS